MEEHRRNLISICFSQLGAAISLSFVYVFLPFYVLRVSPYPLQQTLLWVGAIMGVAPMCAAITATLWGSLTHRFRPKSIYLLNLLTNSMVFLLMGFTTNLYLLLILGICQGMVGGNSTVGMILISSTSPKENLPSHIGIFQSTMTLGQLMGPPLGSFAAVMLGYTGSFVSASSLLFLSFICCLLYVRNIPCLPRSPKVFGRRLLDRRVISGWMLTFTVMIQLTFLPSILPKVFEGFSIEQPVALKLAGTVVMLYTATALIGTYVWTSLARRFGVSRMIRFLFLLGVLLQALLAFNRGIVDFTVTRMVQTGLVAATIPLVISVFASKSNGGVIGFLNSARFAGHGAGAFLATSILAYYGLRNVFLFISAIALLAFVASASFLREGTKDPPSHRDS